MSPSGDRFDPRAVLRAFERARVDYVLIGGLARVIRGSDEMTEGVDLVPSARAENLARVARALELLEGRRADGSGSLEIDPDELPLVAFDTDAGPVSVVIEPAGTQGYDDLRRKAVREHLGEGLRVPVAAAGDLVRMLDALGREQDQPTIETMQRVLELDRGIGWER